MIAKVPAHQGGTKERTAPTVPRRRWPAYCVKEIPALAAPDAVNSIRAWSSAVHAARGGTSGVCGRRRCASYATSSRHIAYRMPASRRASATTAMRFPRRCAIWVVHARSAADFWREFPAIAGFWWCFLGVSGSFPSDAFCCGAHQGGIYNARWPRAEGGGFRALPNDP